MSGLSLGPDAQPGNYRLEITAAVVGIVVHVVRREWINLPLGTVSCRQHDVRAHVMLVRAARCRQRCEKTLNDLARDLAFV